MLWNSKTDLPAADRWTVAWIMVALLYPSWVWSGGHHLYAWPMGIIAALAGFALLVRPLLFRTDAEERRIFWQGLRRDPVLWVGGAYVLLLLVRWGNAWWPLKIEEGAASVWFTGQPRMPGLPSAVTASEAGILAFGYLNALVLALLARHGLQSRRAIRHLFGALLVNAALLAAFGLVQYVSGTDSIYWTVPCTRHFFASFYYENHAGEYFYLMFGLAVGYTLYYLCAHPRRPSRRFLVAMGVVLALTYLAGVFSLSRMAIVMVTLLFILGAGYMVRHAPSYLTPLSRLHMITGLAAICILGLVLVSGTLGEDIRDDFARSRPGQNLVEQALQARSWQWEAAGRIWLQHPLYGVGSYSFRYFLPFYTPGGKLGQLAQEHAGQVHNDLLNLLCEQGLLGTALMLALLVLLLWPAWRNAAGQREILRFPLLAAMLVLLHSLIDLPFLSPAVFGAWFLLVAACGRYAELRSGGSSADSTPPPIP